MFKVMPLTSFPEWSSLTFFTIHCIHTVQVSMSQKSRFRTNGEVKKSRGRAQKMSLPNVCVVYSPTDTFAILEPWGQSIDVSR